MENKKRLLINMVAGIISFLVSIGISFFLSPFIIKNIGTEANGFVSLANNFVNYATLLVIALNSMAGRYITIKIHQKNYEEANKYFSSILIANIVISLVMLLPSFFIIFFLDKLINIPLNLVNDVKILFGFIFLNFMISIIGTTYSVSTFATNRLDLSSKRTIEANFLKAGILFLLFTLLKPNVFYVGTASVATTLYTVIFNIYYTKKLLPNIEIKKKNFDLKKIIEIIKSGIWNTVTKLGQILSDGLDLLITNLFINPLAMGQLALAKTISTIIMNLVSTVSSIFQPQLTMYYAKGNGNKMLRELKFSMKTSGFFTNIPLCFMVAFGFYFFSLWVPGQDINLIQLLSVLSIMGLFVGGVLDPIWNIFAITNKLKVNSLVIVGTGLLNTLIVFILLNTTNFGVVAIAGVSTITAIIKNLTFTPMYAAHCLNENKKTFYPIIFRYLFTTIIMCLIFMGFANIIMPESWFGLILSVALCGICGAIINWFLLFNKEERKFLIGGILSKLLKSKKSVDKLYICHTYYHLLSVLIRVINNNEKIDIVLTNEIKNYKKIAKKLEELKLFENVYTLELIKINIPCNNVLDVMLYNHRVRKQIKFEFIKNKIYNDIFLFNDWNCFGYYFQAHKINYHLIEDGKGCYKTIDKFVDVYPTNLKSKLERKLGLIPTPFGTSKLVLDIEVNENKDIKIKDKPIIENSFNNLIQQLNDKQKKDIYDVFIDKEVSFNSKGNNILIITQPFFEDGIVKNEDTQEKIYKYIINTYGKGNKIFIKPHPRDNTNYNLLFPNAEIISKNFPLEILNFNSKVKFKTAITVTSTAIDNIKFCQNKKKMGWDWLEKFIKEEEK